jgi:hypothetical protein
MLPTEKSNSAPPVSEAWLLPQLVTVLSFRTIYCHSIIAVILLP